MKVALYARVSMDERADDKRYQEPENQLEPLRVFAKSMDYEIYSEYVDRGSGADPGRPRYMQMIRDASQHQFSKIIVWKLDRLSRESPSKVLSLLEKLKSYRIGVKSYTESWADTSQDNPTSELILAVMAWASAEERRKISERTKAGIQRLRNIGKWHGGRPKKGGVVPIPSVSQVP
jgi:DNA invertase Pin-like site-specific DNA recombinase